MRVVVPSIHLPTGQNFDTVLFFKMGKFYETFHMDAVLTVKECGLIFMKKEYAHAGFPETSFYRWDDEA